MGSAVARAYGHEGARVMLAGRSLAPLDVVAAEIRAAGGTATTAEVDVDDEDVVERHADDVVDRAGRIDIAFNAAGMDDVQGVPLVDMSVDDFMTPITQAARRHFITARAAARRMAAQGSGVIVMLSSSAAREWRHQMGGFNLACAGVEALTQSLAGEFGRHGVRSCACGPTPLRRRTTTSPSPRSRH